MKKSKIILLNFCVEAIQASEADLNANEFQGFSQFEPKFIASTVSISDIKTFNQLKNANLHTIQFFNILPAGLHTSLGKLWQSPRSCRAL